MKTRQYNWKPETGWDKSPKEAPLLKTDLLIIFGATSALITPEPLEDIKKVYPHSTMIGCSTAGEICSTTVSDNSLVVTAISFDKTTIKTASVSLKQFENCEEAAFALGKQFPTENLSHLLVFADGVIANGSGIARGLNRSLPEETTISGGLAGDGAQFEKSYTLLNGEIEKESAIAVGFYSTELTIGIGSRDGWIPFGPKRLITSSEGNKLLGLDGHSALDLYKRYLGKEATNLPAAGLLFPLSVEIPGNRGAVVRSITGVDEARGGIDFAGDVPVGSYVQLMRAMANEIIEGAAKAAEISKEDGSSEPDLALLISCTGRKNVLKQLTEEETESVADLFPNNPTITGFYSYGEIAPLGTENRAALHNQTMSITTFTESK